MTDIAAELATIVREAKPGSSDFYKTAQERLRASRLVGSPATDTDFYVRWRVVPPKREDVATLYVDIYMEEGDSLDGGVLLAQLMKVNGPTFQRMSWNNVPAIAPGTTEVTGVVSGRRVRFDVTSLYGALTLEDGSISPWMSFRFRRRNVNGTTWFVGPKGGRWAPRMVLTTQPKEFDPTDLRPVGTVGVLKPVFEWTAPLEVSHYQVQVDDLGGDFTTLLYDSGQIAAVGQVRNRITHSSATGPVWAGIPAGGASWRVSHKTGTTWSGWVEGEVDYVAKAAPALLNPGAVDADPTPPLSWDLPADSVQVLITRDNQVVEDEVVPGPVTTYTPKKGARTPGEVVTREVRWFDGVDRVASIGDPPWVPLVQDTTWTPTATVAPLDSLEVELDVDSPLVIAKAIRASLPDAAWFGWDGNEGTVVEVADGLTLRDWTVPPNTEVEYKGRAVVNGEHSEGEAVVTVQTRVTGVWLVDPETERGFRLAGTDGLEVASRELVVVNEPISAAALIRRTLILGDEAGSIRGQFTDWPGRTLEQQREDALWMRQRPERPFRLIMGDLNIPVTTSIGKPVFDAQMSRHDRLFHNIAFTFSHAGDEE